MIPIVIHPYETGRAVGQLDSADASDAVGNFSYFLHQDTGQVNSALLIREAAFRINCQMRYPNEIRSRTAIKGHADWLCALKTGEEALHLPGGHPDPNPIVVFDHERSPSPFHRLPDPRNQGTLRGIAKKQALNPRSH